MDISESPKERETGQQGSLRGDPWTPPEEVRAPSGTFPGQGTALTEAQLVRKQGDRRKGATFGDCDGNQNHVIYKPKDQGLRPRKQRVCHTPDWKGLDGVRFTSTRGRVSLPVPVPFRGASATGPHVAACSLPSTDTRRRGGGFLPAVTGTRVPWGLDAEVTGRP